MLKLSPSFECSDEIKVIQKHEEMYIVEIKHILKGKCNGMVTFWQK